MIDSNPSVNLVTQPKKLTIMYTALILLYISILFIPLLYLDSFTENKYIYIVISYSIIILFIGWQIFNNRQTFFETFEAIFKIKPVIVLDKNGLYLKTKFYNKFYTWNDLKEVVRETTSEQSKFEVVIVTNDAKIFTIKDDSNWRQFKLITDWIDSKIIKNDIIEHYIDPETGVEI